MYNITNGQLITLWVLDIILLIGSTLSGAAPLALITFIGVFVLIFYTLGWKKHNKQKPINIDKQ